jgi:FkbM family methyltransferase
MISFQAATGLSPAQKIVHLGANPIDGDPPYIGLMRAGSTDVVGFEPNREALARLNAQKGERETYLPHAIGDGQRHTLHICAAPGMTSLLAPDPDILGLFHGFPQWGQVVAREDLDTVRLDDVPETEGVTLLMMDIQGAELMALRHAEARLRDALVLHLEVEFMRLYKDQPLFTDVDLFLRQHGFVLHKFSHQVSRVIQPVVVDNNIYRGLSQLVWADAVFIRDFTGHPALRDDQLLASAAILHECYASVDVVHHLLATYDRRHQTSMAPRYLASLRELAA